MISKQKPLKKALSVLFRHIYIITIEKKKKKFYYFSMSCENPVLAIKYGVDFETHKEIIRIFPQRADFNYKSLVSRHGEDNVLLLPCGHCPSCILAKKREWSVRCELEARLHEKNCFVTLTYDDFHYPGHLVKKDLQQFIKALRNKGFSFRYFACGEYGSETGRGHYHLILFGLFPDDAVPFAQSKSNDPMLKSKLLESCWNKGIVTCQIFEKEMAGYVAGYTSKKLLQDCSNMKYPPFLLMSTKPGIGRDYFVSGIDHYLDDDHIILKNGFVYQLPRYFLKVAEDLGHDVSELKHCRIEKAKLKTSSDMWILNIGHEEEYYKHSCKGDKLFKRKRGL